MKATHGMFYEYDCDLERTAYPFKDLLKDVFDVSYRKIQIFTVLHETKNVFKPME